MLVRNNAGRAGLRAYLGDRAFYTKIAQIAIPIMLQSLITVGINLMDTIMLSSMGDAQLSASSLAGQFINLFHICCMGIGMGASVLTARFWGMEDLPSLRQAVTIMLRLVTAFALLFTIATILTPTGILWIYTKDAEIIEYGAIYLRWLIPTYLCMGLSLTCTIVLRSVGQVQIPLISSILAFFINVFFNWVFIFGRLGAPRMEIAGAALGTLIARAFVAANSVTVVVQQLSSVFTQGLSNASGIITGHTMGEGDFEKAQRQGYTFLGLGLTLGLLAAALILILRAPIINYYQVSEEARVIAWSLMDSIAFIMVFQSMNSILTKGVLRAGGDTKFLMAGDILFLWVASVPLGALAGLALHLPAFWIYTFLKIDQVIKCVWCVFRLRSRKWMKKIYGSADAAQARQKTA